MKLKLITLTNDGYADYTLNCLKSLQNINFDRELISYSIGESCHNKIINNKYKIYIIKYK